MGQYTGLTKGGTRIDQRWGKNDGRVNTISEISPFGAPRKHLEPENLEPGIWNVYPVYKGDHMSLQGGLLHKKNIRSFYTDLLTMISAVNWQIPDFELLWFWAGSNTTWRANPDCQLRSLLTAWFQNETNQYQDTWMAISTAFAVRVLTYKGVVCWKVNRDGHSLHACRNRKNGACRNSYRASGMPPRFVIVLRMIAQGPRIHAHRFGNVLRGYWFNRNLSGNERNCGVSAHFLEDFRNPRCLWTSPHKIIDRGYAVIFPPWL